MSQILRPMEERDLIDARELWAQADGVELAEGDEVDQLSSYLRRNPETSFVACEGDRLVGAVLAGHDGRRGFLYHLVVASEARGKGIGKALAQRSLLALKAAGVVRVLILVSRDNTSGREFWSKQGWESMTFAEPMGIDL